MRAALVLAAITLASPRALAAPALGRDAVVAAVKPHVGEVSACYQKALSRKPWLAGRLVVSFTIDGAGRVARAEIERTELPDVRFLACALDAVRAWTFARAAGDDVSLDFSYPFELGGGVGDPSVLVDGKPRPAVLPERCKLKVECRELGAALARGSDAERARSFGYFEAGCALADAESCAGASLALDFGRGVAKDKKRALALAEKACALGAARACTIVAMTHGLGVDGVAKRDAAKGAALLARACHGGDGDGGACLNLAERTRLGLGVARDEAKAAELRAKALAAEERAPSRR